MEEIKKIIREKRPNITDSSVKTYASLLKNLYFKDESNKGKDIMVDWFKNAEKVLPLLKEKTPQTRKTNLAAIIVLLDGKAPKEYISMMNEDADKTKENYEKQEKSEKQEENWIDYDDIVALWNARYKKVKTMLYNTEPKDKREIQELVKFMAMTLTGGIFFEPRRSEWIYVKVRNYDPKTENYLDLKNNQFVFHKYKTAKSLGTERITFPKEFKAILTRYLKFIDNDYLIFNARNDPMTNVNLTQVLNGIYGKKLSTSMLRHIYLSHKFKDMPSLKEMNATAASMGHSVETMLEYIKK
jgi:integrase